MQRHKTDYPGVSYVERKRKGTEGVEKVYYVSFKKNGKKIEREVGWQYVDKMTAAKAARIRADYIEGRREINPKPEPAEQALIYDSIDKVWARYLQMNGNIKGLIQDKNRYEKHIQATFGMLPPKDITPMMISSFRSHLSQQLKPGSVKNILEVLRRILNYAQKEKLCETSETKVRIPVIHNEKTEILSAKQEQALMEELDKYPFDPTAAMVRVGLKTAMRPGEIIKLRWDDINFDFNFILLRDTKAGTDQYVPMTPDLAKFLRQLPREDSPYIFPGKGGRQRTEAPRKAARRIMDRAGIPQSFRPFYTYRHNLASKIVCAPGGNLYMAQKLLRHSSPAMTQRYAHLDEKQLMIVMEKVEPKIDANQSLPATPSQQSDKT